jgi:outer membrane protein assembly factor BamB
LIFVVMGLASAPSHADNWPQWRGPTLDGVSSEQGLPLRWSAEENVVWKLPLPARSGSTPIVWDDRIFLNVSYDPEQDDRLELWCVDRHRGQVLWKRPLGAGNELKYKQHMSSPSPVTDGRRVWVMTGTGVLKAFDFEGRELWARDLQKDYGPFGHNWGYAASPLLWEGSLFVAVLHGMKTDDPSYLLRIDGETGKDQWRVERPTEAVFESPDAYTTPMMVTTGDRAELAVSGGDVVTGHDPATGRELWRAAGLNPNREKTQRLVASPLSANGLIYAFGKRGPVLALRPGGAGNVTTSHLAWSTAEGIDVPTPVTDGKYLYLVGDRGILHVVEALTGKPVYGPERLAAGTYSASPVLADGRLYAVSEAGVTTVVKLGPSFEVLAENELGGYTLSSPAVSDGQIFLRTAEFLYVIGPRKPQGGG